MTPSRYIQRSSALLLLLALLLTAWTPTVRAQAQLAPGLQTTLDGLAPQETIEVVVTFTNDGPISLDQRTSLLELGIAQGIYMQNLPIIGVVATASQIEALALRSDVRSIWPNAEVPYSNAEGREITGVNAVRTDNDFRVRNGGMPVAGSGIGVVVHDSGIDAAHADLEYGRRVVQNVQGLTNLNGVSGLLPRTATEGQINTDLGSGHGTHVAGTVGGNGARSGGLYEGMAPGADLIGYGSGAVLFILDTVGGFDYAITHQTEYNIRVITNSWGGAGNFDPNHPVNVASYATYKRGITVLFAAGNDGPGADTITRYAAPWAITVAAGNKDGATLTGFSSRGNEGESFTFTQPDGTTWTYRAEPTITAPGNDIVSTSASTGPLGTPPLDPAYAAFYVQMDGTSMATPHVAGIVALILEANPSLQPMDVINMIKDTATPMNYDMWEAGAGHVNAYAAVAAAFGIDPTTYLKCGFHCSDDDGMTDDGVMLTDDEGDASQPGTDITSVKLHDVTADGFQLTMTVPDLAAATPSTMMAAGLQVGAMQEYEVEFDLLREGLSTVRYSVSAKQTLVDAGTDGLVLSGASFDYGIRAANGSGRGMGDLTGTWDAENGTITYEIPFSIMNVETPPPGLTDDIDRTGRTPVAGDILTAFGATVNTSFWGGVVGLTPGQTNWDGANGTSSYTIGDDVGDEDDGDGNGDGGDENGGGDTGGDGHTNDDARVVVAVIDSGINPYHEFFRAGGEPYTDSAPSSVTQEILDAFGIGQDQILNLTDFDSDAALWASVETGKYYWFTGTNIIARSFSPGSRIILPDDNDDTHGVGTSAAVVRANPDAVIVFYEGISDASETEAFNHPAIDMVSTSYGPIGSIPLPYHITNSFVGVVQNGKMHFGASDNSASTAIQDGTAGPWWSIGINGLQEGTAEGKQAMSGSLADFAADFTQSLPYCDVCTSGFSNVSGTSFATPRSAGTASLILLEARRALGHSGGIADVNGTMAMATDGTTAITTWDIRRAMEESAYYPGVADYEPAGGPSTWDLAAIPVLDAAPYTLVGWGVLRPEADFGVVSQTLAHLGIGDEDIQRTKGLEPCTFQTALIASRHIYWDFISSESDGSDPYQYCSAGALKGDALAGTGTDVPQDYVLEQNYPNPFNPSTTIRFALPAEGQVTLSVYNILGQRIATLIDGQTLNAGTHAATFEASDLGSGMYLYRLATPNAVITKTMMLMK